MAPVGDAGQQVIADFRAHMENDLATPQALAVLFGAVTAANSALDRGDGPAGVDIGRAALEGFEAVGVVAAGAASVPQEILGLARKRDDARSVRDWSAADRLRDEIVAAGYRIEDTAGGTRVYR